MATDTEALDFPEARQLIKVRNQSWHKKDGKQEDATRYFVCSIGQSKRQPQDIAQRIRSHWGVESSHWRRDASWGEDKCRIRNRNAACALALLRTSLLALVKRVGRHSLPEVFEDVADDLSLAIGWLKNRNL